MSTIFISDLHLSPDAPKTASVFLNFLQQQVQQAEALYILGDFFEAWMGDDNVDNFNQNIIQALQKITQAGIPIYFMHGNRDFLIGQRFVQQTGCKLLPDPTVIDLYGTCTLLTHGDLLCIEDTNYLRFRKLVRHPLFQALFLRLPLKIRENLAKRTRQKSKQYIQSYEPNISNIRFDATLPAIKDMIQKYDVTQLIHGHTHRPAIHLFSLNNGNVAKRIVLSDWHHQGNALICESSGESKLVYF